MFLPSSTGPFLGYTLISTFLSPLFTLFLPFSFSFLAFLFSFVVSRFPLIRCLSLVPSSLGLFRSLSRSFFFLSRLFVVESDFPDSVDDRFNIPCSRVLLGRGMCYQTHASPYCYIRTRNGWKGCQSSVVKPIRLILSIF